MPERSSFAPGTPSWVDLSTTDPDAARDFYGPLLGWEYVIDPSEETGHYATATARGKNVAGVNGMSITEQPPAWTTYFATDDAQKLSELVTENGGAIAMGPMQVGPAGTMLIWQDPSGAFAGAWQAGDMKGAQLVQEPGAIAWNELNTRDLAAALAFYTAILPVTAHDMSDGDFHYQTLQVDGVDVAGMWEMSAGPAQLGRVLHGCRHRRVRHPSNRPGRISGHAGQGLAVRPPRRAARPAGRGLLHHRDGVREPVMRAD